MLTRLRKVAAAKGVDVAVMLDTKGPEIRTAMLSGGQDVSIQAGEEVELVAVGANYTTWEGGRDSATGGRLLPHATCHAVYLPDVHVSSAKAMASALPMTTIPVWEMQKSRVHHHG